ncbi:hypothetical protein E3O37_34355 [Burkholderia pseudomallei]|nr:hypothetical protein E3O37_34355 [Burkholderia pseudomallei]
MGGPPDSGGKTERTGFLSRNRHASQPGAELMRATHGTRMEWRCRRDGGRNGGRDGLLGLLGRLGRLGGSAARRLGGSAARRLGGSAE